MSKLSETVNRKFVDVIDTDEWEVLSDTGFVDITSINKTIEYQEWIVRTESGKELICADTHILMDENHNEVFAKDSLGIKVITTDGIEEIISVVETNNFSNMYDLSVDSIDHTYYTNDILSHNTILITAYLLWQTIFNNDLKVGVTSYIGAGAKEVMDRFRYAYEMLPHWLKPGVKVYNVFDIVFDNGSSIISATTTENTFRGKSMSILFLDELGHVKPKIADAFWTSLLPSMSAGGNDGVKLIVSSTPNGSEGLFANLWFKAENDESDFHANRVYNEEVPGRDELFKSQMLQTMSLNKYDQEFNCQFISDKGTLIQSTILEALRPSTPIKTVLGMDFYTSVRNKRLGVSVDVAEGIGSGGDYTVIQCFDIDSLEQVGEFRDNNMSISAFTKHFIKILTELDSQGAKEIYYTVESNPIGLSVINLLENATHSILNKVDMVSEYRSKRSGLLTTNKSKLAGCSSLKDYVEEGKMKIHSKYLLSELKFFIKKGASFAAESGMHDDLVMATVVFCNLLKELARYDEDVSDTVNKITTIDCMSEDEAPLPFIV